MISYKILCINLKRRPDRRRQMVEVFERIGIYQYAFFDAIDGNNLDMNDPDLNLFKHNNPNILRKGIVGCALSHYKIWKMLVNDKMFDYYVIFEDDVQIADNFIMHLENFLKKMDTNTDILYLGMHMEKINRENTKPIFYDDVSYTIHPFSRNWYAGGLFGYIITKNGAIKLDKYITKNGIKMVIDYLTFRAPISLYETHPHLVFSNCVQHSDHDVDSDIQKDFSKIIFNLLDNKNIFNDYLFYPNRDSVGNDIMESYADINRLKQIADSMDNCVAFNTYGWLKFALLPDDKFTNIGNKYYQNDGIYIKKKYITNICNKPLNDYHFDDYIFYCNKDSVGHNIMHLLGSIPELKMVADAMEECAGFSSHGYLKYEILDEKYFSVIKNDFNLPDGLYVKKSHHPDTILLNKKLEKLKNILANRPINIFINVVAIKYSKWIVEMILNKFQKYYLVPSSSIYDISINHIVEESYYYNDHSLNILISGEPWNIKPKFDIAIDTKYQSNARYTIYYPYLFSSIHEHKKSININDYLKPKTKFCAYMYQMSHEHRIKYFELLSTYKKVDALGKCCNNIKIENTRHKYDDDETYQDIAVRYYSDYKFVLAIENSMVPGYATEKLLNPLIAGSVPIYWGNADIFKHINKKRIIYIPDFSTNDEILDYIKFLDTNDNYYQQIIDEPIYLDPEFRIDKMDKELDDNIGKILDMVN